MLAVIDDEQQLLASQPFGDRFVQRSSAGLAHAHRARNNAWHKFWIGNRGKIRKPYAVAEMVDEICAELQGNARLAHPSGARNGYETVLVKQGFRIDQIVFSTDERRKLERQIVWPFLKGIEGRKV